MSDLILRTPRLRLVGATPALLRAEGDDRARFGQLLNARVADRWPPELYDDDARLWTLAAVEREPQHAGWWMYYVVVEDAGEVVGVVGYKGPPGDDGTVEVGYGIVPGHRRRGIATEATAALVDRAFADPRVTRVIAETMPELVASIGVMEKLGFTLEGDGSEPGVIRYTLPRPRWSERREPAG
ncbi:MAG TPA: GNAT family N-acetyltransferase [Longimicrobium sp.]|nr:GNAT family N-acetyltransferase [Longimicrobium sp.]